MFSATYARATLVGNCVTPSYQSAVQVELMRFQPKQVNLFSLGEPYREGNDSCRVFILDMHILLLHGLILISGMANQGVVVLHMGDNHTANHDNVNHGAQPQPPPSLAQAVAALIADRNEQTELIRQLVQATTGRGRQPPPPLAETDYVSFLATQPPLFHKADDPLEADAWIRTIEDKFGILNCIEMDKAAFAAQQL